MLQLRTECCNEQRDACLAVNNKNISKLNVVLRSGGASEVKWLDVRCGLTRAGHRFAGVCWRLSNLFITIIFQLHFALNDKNTPYRGLPRSDRIQSQDTNTAHTTKHDRHRSAGDAHAV